MRNRELALESACAPDWPTGSAVERPRVATTPSASARARRLTDKRRRSARKRDRARPTADDD